ncbi:AMP-dependent synthetase and ligase [Candidatus Koribacter versatilis Ellin345]|uniref:AMP-dependent synthetase and ligase n=1 Tax=Koribacter versatilis (strain Ellin345) TaxID=204669 RepID=Q1IPW8_KORVE|nr:long-chain fatty acid--CoA ligase [Candidatus Koribacter versatilis]ABF41082.1 AMP-dependent synthetase and ligase [Candidatus Koribacter versatilis Ellin345]
MAIELKTINDVFFAVVDRQLSQVMAYREGANWKYISSQELYRRVVATARWLQLQGVKKGDRVAILSENRPEWAIADFAVLAIGAVVVPIYATLTPEHISYLLKDSGTRVIFLSTRTQLQKVRAIEAQTPLQHVVMMDEVIPPEAIWMQTITESGTEGRDAGFDATAKSLQSDDLATLVYTSGTTGNSKGAIITHGNMAANLSCSLEGFAALREGGHRLISFLPLSHITARHLDYQMFHHGVMLAYCPNVDMITALMKEIRPTIFVAVPRVYEKISTTVKMKAAEGIKKKIYDWAMRVGAKHQATILVGNTPTSLDWKLANKLLFSKVREAMGGEVQFFISGGAPLGRELAEWYASFGIRIHEGYGLTETSPVIALNNPKNHRLGTVGPLLSNVEVKIASDGEILVRGPSVFKGYWNMPTETTQAFEGEWFKTGDIGHLDGEGFLSITDRKKDLIKTSGGKFIAPQPIEGSLKVHPMVAEAAMVGEKRRFPAVMILPNFPLLEEWAKKNAVSFDGRDQLVTDPKVIELYTQIVEQVNGKLAQYEKMKKLLILPTELSIAEGTMTASMKLRRRQLEAKFRDQIEAMYAVENGAPERVAAN